jgi:hypothetical protein
MPAATKRKQRRDEEPVAAPAVAPDRVALAAAIERKRRADRAVEEQHQAINRARQRAVEMDDHIRALRGKIAEADETDVKRAASLLRIDKPIASGWVGESARSNVEHAERNLMLIENALKRLRQDLKELEADAVSAQTAVALAVKLLSRPIAQRLLDRVRADRRRVMIDSAMLAELVSGDTGGALSEIKVAFDHARFATVDDDYKAASTALAELRATLAELQHNASAELPEV